MHHTNLYQAILSLENQQEVERFFTDLCTPQEIEEMQKRWQVCQILEKGELSYREINASTGVSLATIGRVARFLKTEKYHGYKLVLERQNTKT